MNQGAIALRDAVSESGLLICQVEELVGVSSGYVTRIIAGERLPSRALARRINELFPGVPMASWDEPTEAPTA